jgi:hypothetical protein
VGEKTSYPWGRISKNHIEVPCQLVFWPQIIGEPRKKPVEKNSEAWSCPPEGCLKINVDASYDPDIGIGGMGVIARDFTG